MNESLKIRSSIEKGKLLLYTDTQRAEKIFSEIQQITSGEHLAVVNTYLAFARFMLSTNDDMLPMLRESHTILIETSNWQTIAANLNYQATIYDSYGDYDKALELNIEALNLATKNQLEEIKAACYNTAGNIYFRMKQFDEAEINFNACLQSRELLTDEPGIASVCNQLGRLHLNKKEFDLSLDFYERSYNIRSKKGNETALPWSEMGMAHTLFGMNKKKEALQYFHSALTNGIKYNDFRVQLYCYSGLGDIYNTNGEINQAEDHYIKALEISIKLHAKMQEGDLYKKLSEVEEQKKNFRKANEFLKIHIAIREEILNAETTEKIQQLRTSYKIEKAEQEAEIYRLKNVELKHAYEKISEYAESISDSIHYALRIQKAILSDPETIQEIEDQLFIINKPRDIVSGDFYWFTKIRFENKTKFIIVLADCTGHGVPGAFMSMIGTDKLNHIVLEKKIFEPAAILEELNIGIRRSLKQTSEESQSKDGMEMGICLYDPIEKTLDYAASNRPLLITRKDQAEIEIIRPDKITIGGYSEKVKAQFTQHNISLKEGDCFYLYSDGIPDQFGGEKNKKFSTKKLIETITELKNKNTREREISITNIITAWIGNNEQTDDILLMGITV